jgi:hypothetical protein
MCRNKEGEEYYINFLKMDRQSPELHALDGGLGGGVWLDRIVNGKIIEAREDEDVLEWMQQFGTELKPKYVRSVPIVFLA